MIELSGDPTSVIFRYGQRIGIIHGQTAFLFRLLSGRDMAKLKNEFRKREGKDLEFGTIGSIEGLATAAKHQR